MMLARREYGRAILAQKLLAKGFAGDLVDGVLDRLQAEGLQSDARCAEAILRTGEGRGWSRHRCRRRMLQERLSDTVIANAPWPNDSAERALARSLYDKWLSQGDGDTDHRQRVLRRLARRGFAVGFLLDEG